MLIESVQGGEVVIALSAAECADIARALREGVERLDELHFHYVETVQAALVAVGAIADHQVNTVPNTGRPIVIPPTQPGQ